MCRQNKQSYLDSVNHKSCCKAGKLRSKCGKTQTLTSNIFLKETSIRSLLSRLYAKTALFGPMASLKKRGRKNVFNSSTSARGKSGFGGFGQAKLP
jgi:hypothetical protein